MKVIVDSLAVYYEDSGTGPVVLLLHGWGDSLHSFDMLAARLDGYRLVRLDLPGFGQSELPPATWDVSAYADFVANFCKKIDIDAAYLIGHSFGGRIIIKAIAEEVLSAQKIIFIASAGVADRDTMHNKFFTRAAKAGKFFLRPFPESWYLRLRKELYRVTGGDYVSAGALKETFLRVINEDLSKYAKKISVPSLLIWGEDDLVTPLAEGKKLEHLIHGAKLHVFSGAGHFVHQQKADEVAALIRGFLV